MDGSYYCYKFKRRKYAKYGADGKVTYTTIQDKGAQILTFASIKNGKYRAEFMDRCVTGGCSTHLRLITECFYNILEISMISLQNVNQFHELLIRDG